MRFFAILGALLFVAVSARADEVRYPETGMPAVTFSLPDGWTAQPDDQHNLLVASGDRSVVVTMSMIEWSGPLDTLATEVLAVAKADPPTDKTAVSVLGLHANAFRSGAMQSDGKTPVKLRLIDIQIDPTHAFICTIISNKQDDDPGYMAGIRFVDKLKLATK